MLRVPTFVVGTRIRLTGHELRIPSTLNPIPERRDLGAVLALVAV